MNVSEEIIKVLDYISEKFGMAMDWTSDNIMPYFTELCDKIVKYEICTSIIWLIIFSVAIALCIIYARKCIKLADEYEAVDILAIVLIIAAAAFSIGFLVQIFDIVKCGIFPEKYLMEYFTNLLKGGC